MGGISLFIVLYSYFLPSSFQNIDIKTIVANNKASLIIPTSTGYSTFQSPDLFNYIITTDKNIYTSFSWGEKTLPLLPSHLYWFSFRGLFWFPEFWAEQFTLELLSPWEFYVDGLTSSGKIFLYSQTAKLKLTLHSTNKTEVYKTIFLLPGNYIEFTPSKWKYIKNTDASRVQIIHTSWILLQPIYDAVSDDFALFYKKWQEDFLKNIFFVESQRNKKWEIFSQESKKFISQNISYNSSFQKYSFFFLNPEKQKIFYKNKILWNYIDIWNTHEIDEEKIKEITDTLEYLKSTDVPSYRDVLEIMKYICFVHTFYLTEVDIPVFMRFTEILSEHTIERKDLYAFITLGIQGFKNNELWFQEYISYVEKNYKLIDPFEIQFFVTYIESYISYFLSIDVLSNEKISELLKLCELHAILVEYSYAWENVTEINGVYLQANLLKNINTFFLKNYFLPQRSIEKLLVLQNSNTFQREHLAVLKKLYEIFSNNYTSKASLFDLKDKKSEIVNREMSQELSIMNEYITAWNDYGYYSSSYDPQKQELYDLEDINQWWLYSVSDIENFLEKFEGVPSIYAVEEDISWQFFQIHNLVISWKTFQFDIFPYEDFTIKNIFVNDEKIGFSYKLFSGDLKELFWENTSTISSLNSKFFLDTFFKKDEISEEEFFLKVQEFNEDKSIIVFKRETLLWKNGIFIKLFPEIVYNNIQVIKKEKGYEIFLKDVLLTSLWIWGESKLVAQYFYGEWENYFSNTILQISSPSSGRDIVINFIWKIPLSQMSAVLKSFIIQLEEFNTVIDYLQSLSHVWNIEVQYTITTKKITIKFDSFTEKYSITFAWGQIERFTRGNTSFIPKKIPASSLWIYFK